MMHPTGRADEQPSGLLVVGTRLWRCILYPDG